MKSFPTLTYPQTPPDIKRWFYERGLTVTEWSQVHGFPREVVYAALAGRTRGFRGQAHDAAVALGLKKGCVEATEDYASTTISPETKEK